MAGLALPPTLAGSKERDVQGAMPFSSSTQQFDYIELTAVYGAPSTGQTPPGARERRVNRRVVGLARACVAGDIAKRGVTVPSVRGADGMRPGGAASEIVPLGAQSVTDTKENQTQRS